MTADYHLHSCFSGDSETPTEDIIKKGLERGLSLMCMTEHLDLDYPYEDVSFDLDAEAYVREMRRLQDVYRNRLELRIGVEIGLQPHLGDAYRTWLSDKSFDFLIGSTHLVDRFDPYYPDFWSSYDAASGVNRYLDVTLQKYPGLSMISTCMDTSIISSVMCQDGGAHFPLRAARRPGGRDSEAAYRKGQGHRDQHRRLQSRTLRTEPLSRRAATLPGTGRGNHHHGLRRPHHRVCGLSVCGRQRGAQGMRLPVFYGVPRAEGRVCSAVNIFQ